MTHFIILLKRLQEMVMEVSKEEILPYNIMVLLQMMRIKNTVKKHTKQSLLSLTLTNSMTILQLMFGFRKVSITSSNAHKG